MKVLVTGSGGFVGKFLVERLRQLGVEEIVCHTRAELDSVPPDCEHFPAIVGPKTDWTEALIGVDVVFHLAARAHKLADQRYGEEATRLYRSVNRDGSIRLAEQAAQSGVKRFIFLSSIGVNGIESFDVPFTADDMPNPQTPYAISKLEAEQELTCLSRKVQMEIVIVRAPLVYGAQAPGNLGVLLYAVRSLKVLPFGSIRYNRRSFISVENLVDFLISGCLLCKAAKNEIFVVSDGQDISTTELIVNMANAFSVKVWLLPIPSWILRIGFWLVRKPHLSTQLFGNLQIDIEKAERLLNWKPPYTMNDSFQTSMQKL